MSENDPYGSEGGALNDRPYPYWREKHSRLHVVAGFSPRSLVFRCDEDDFAGFHEFQFFAGEFFDGTGVGAEGLDFVSELLVLCIDPDNVGFKRGKLCGLGVHLN